MLVFQDFHFLALLLPGSFDDITQVMLYLQSSRIYVTQTSLD